MISDKWKVKPKTLHLSFLRICRNVFLAISLCFAIFANLYAYAEDSCVPIRLDAPGYSMEHVPVLDQGPFLDCYANSAVQAVDAYRFSHGDKNYSQHSSALMAAARSDRNRLIRKDTIDADDAYRIMASMSNLGSCSAEGIKSAQGYTIEQYMAHIRDLQDEIASKTVIAKLNLFDYATLQYSQRPTDPTTSNKVENSAEQVCMAFKAGGFDINLLPSLGAIKNILIRGESSELIDSIVGPYCKGKNAIPAQTPKPNVFAPLYDSPNSFKIAINKVLDGKNPQPVVAGYCSAVLSSGKDYDGKVSGFGSITNGQSKDCGFHESLIIGRRKNKKTGICQFLVRNSWGTSCNGHNYSKDWDCESGNLWVDEDSFTRNEIDLSWLP